MTSPRRNECSDLVVILVPLWWVKFLRHNATTSQENSQSCHGFYSRFQGNTDHTGLQVRPGSKGPVQVRPALNLNLKIRFGSPLCNSPCSRVIIRPRSSSGACYNVLCHLEYRPNYNLHPTVHVQFVLSSICARYNVL